MPRGMKLPEYDPTKYTMSECKKCNDVTPHDKYGRCGYIEEVKIGKADEIVLRIPKDEVDKLRYALEHVYLTGDEHIDGVLSTFLDVLKEEINNRC